MLSGKDCEQTTFNKLAGPNRQSQTGPIGLFSTRFVLICTTNHNLLTCAILGKNVALLAKY